MTSNSRIQSIILLVMSAVTLAIYVPNIPSTFVDWDLVSYKKVLEAKDCFQTTIDLFRDFRGEIVPGYYAPLSSVSLMLDKLITGAASAWLTVFVNLLLHCLVGTLVFGLARTVGANLETAALSAAIFLIHPVQVSSILWFAQRKAVMATALYLAAYISFLRFLQADRWGYFLGSLSFFVAAIFSKPTAVVFPIAIVFTQLLFPYGLDGSGQASGKKSSALGQFLRVAPFFLVSLIFGLITMESEGVTYNENMPDLPLAERPFIAATVVWFYLAKALLPLNNSPLYPLWNVDTSSVLWWFSLWAFAAAAASVFFFRKKVGGPIIWSILNFLVPLLPVCGLLKFGYLRLANVADHFMYVSMVGFAHLTAMSVHLLRSRLRPTASYALSIVVCAYLLFLMIQTGLVGQTWKDSVTLWSYNLKSNPTSWTAHNFLGHALLNAGRTEESIEHFRETIELKESFLKRQDRSSQKLRESGNLTKAELELRKASPIRAGMYIAHHNLGNAYLLSGMPDKAAEEFQIALRFRPDYVNSRVNLGIASLGSGRISDALKYLSGAVKESPNNFEAHYNLGLAYGASGQKTLAEEHFRKAKTLRPDYPIPRLP